MKHFEQFHEKMLALLSAYPPLIVPASFSVFCLLMGTAWYNAIYLPLHSLRIGHSAHQSILSNDRYNALLAELEDLQKKIELAQINKINKDPFLLFASLCETHHVQLIAYTHGSYELTTVLLRASFNRLNKFLQILNVNFPYQITECILSSDASPGIVEARVAFEEVCIDKMSRALFPIIDVGNKDPFDPYRIVGGVS